MRRGIGLLLLFVGIAVLAPRGASGGEGSTAVDDATTSSETSEDLVRRLAAEELADKYSLQLDEATTRIDRQLAVDDLAAAVAEVVGSGRWGGAFIDHADGGTLVVQVTNGAQDRSVRDTIESAAPALADFVEVAEVQHSVQELETLQRELGQQARSNGVEVQLTIDVVENTVDLAPVVPTTGGAADTTEAVEAAEGLKEGHGAAVSVGAPTAGMVESACYSAYQLCDAPLRGGVAIYETPTQDVCTLGFNVRSRSDGRRFVITARHCSQVAGLGATWKTRTPTDGLLHNIGNTHSVSPTTMDAALLDVDNPSGWDQQPYVLVRANSAGPYPTTADNTYYIESVGTTTTLPGDFLCFTSAFRSTECGELLFTNVDDPGGLQDLAVIDQTNCGGDSGSPIFVGHRGYGILIGRDGNDYPTSAWPGIGPANGTACGDNTYYQGLQAANAALNVWLL
jgi:streptogrisin C